MLSAWFFYVNKLQFYVYKNVNKSEKPLNY